MRIMIMVVLCLSVFGSCVYGEPVADSEICFSFPFNCETDSGNRTRCLADVFKLGLSAVLLGKMGICGARTADAFTFDKAYDFEATRLLGTEECFAVKDNERSFTNFEIAIVGADPAAVRLVSVKEDGSPVPKEIELKARKVATPKIEGPRRLIDMTQVPISLSDALPRVFRTGNVTLLIFDLYAEGKPWEPGPSVVLIGDEVFLLEGQCTYGEPVFFSVNDKLYLTYVATVACCGCGDSNSFVYDLSSGTPKMVYRNSSFAD